MTSPQFHSELCIHVGQSRPDFIMQLLQFALGQKRHRETKRQRDGETHRQTLTDPDIGTNTERHRQTQTDTGKYRQIQANTL